MKILISPSKTLTISDHNLIAPTKPLFEDKTLKILDNLTKFTKEDLAQRMKIKGKILDETYRNIHSFNNLHKGIAIASFNGLVYKGLNINDYTINEIDYINNSIVILDAFYGLMKPSTQIRSYRLDFIMNIGIDLYKFWNVDQQIDDDIVINLASKEFIKMLRTTKYITIQFLQKKGDKYINQATYSKQARGIFLNYVIKNTIKTVSELKLFNKLDYIYNNDLSNETTITFTRS